MKEIILPVLSFQIEKYPGIYSQLTYLKYHTVYQLWFIAQFSNWIDAIIFHISNQFFPFQHWVYLLMVVYVQKGWVLNSRHLNLRISYPRVRGKVLDQGCFYFWLRVKDSSSEKHWWYKLSGLHGHIQIYLTVVVV